MLDVAARGPDPEGPSESDPRLKRVNPAFQRVHLKQQVATISHIVRALCDHHSDQL